MEGILTLRQYSEIEKYLQYLQFIDKNSRLVGRFENAQEIKENIIKLL